MLGHSELVHGALDAGVAANVRAPTPHDGGAGAQGAAAAARRPQTERSSSTCRTVRTLMPVAPLPL